MMKPEMSVAEFKAEMKKMKVKNCRLVSKDDMINGMMKRLQLYQIPHEKEGRVCDEKKGRKWRFDIVITHYMPDIRIGIEYEGIFSDKSRHTTLAGYTEDCNKYNEADILGWNVLRYTAKNVKNLTWDVTRLLEKRTSYKNPLK